MGIIRRMKRSAEQLQADELQHETRRYVNGWLREILRKGGEYADDKHREHVAAARARILPDLMEICGVGEPSQVDYDNPHVKILMLNCDPVNQMMLKNPRLRHTVYEKMDPET